jgi:pyruvate/2-oxoglutarate dehydrogenase complex dihydrolipoamide acyltransferase (E2) component
MIEIQIPQLGQAKLEVTIEAWKVNEGEHIDKGAPLYELSNEKLTQEIESPVSGTLAKILVAAGGVVEPGDIIGQIDED